MACGGTNPGTASFRDAYVIDLIVTSYLADTAYLRVGPYTHAKRALAVRSDRGRCFMEFQDKTLKCLDCGADFVFTAGEQLFFHDKHFKNEPKRCKTCKTKRLSALGIGASAGNGRGKVETRTNCSSCGKETTVPFKPTQGRPVLCRECFQKTRPVATQPSA